MEIFLRFFRADPVFRLALLIIIPQVGMIWGIVLSQTDRFKGKSATVVTTAFAVLATLACAYGVAQTVADTRQNQVEFKTIHSIEAGADILSESVAKVQKMLSAVSTLAADAELELEKMNSRLRVQNMKQDLQAEQVNRQFSQLETKSKIETKALQVRINSINTLAKKINTLVECLNNKPNVPGLQVSCDWQ